MGHISVEHNGKWACFSSVVDDFITTFTNLKEYEVWRKEEYGRIGYTPIKKEWVQSIEDVSNSIRLIRNHEDSVQCLVESGISLEESEEIIKKLELKNYCPTLIKENQYKCPNCGTIVSINQERCHNDSCCLLFSWYL